MKLFIDPRRNPAESVGGNTEDALSNAEELSVRERRDRAIDRLNAGHLALKHSLAGMDSQDAFLGSRWSVRDVLLHLDSENFIDALEKIANCEQAMLPPFSTRESQLEKELDRLEETYQRFQTLVLDLSEQQLARPVTPPNPDNAYPGLTMLELIERVAGHESAHARQIEETRKYVEAFKSKERVLNIVELGEGGPDRVAASVKGLINQADYVVGLPAALEMVRPWVRGVELELNQDNSEEIIARMGREVRAGIWAVVCCLGTAGDDGEGTIALARQHADAVVIHQAQGT